jgi:hypothetical protein
LMYHHMVERDFENGLGLMNFWAWPWNHSGGNTRKGITIAFLSLCLVLRTCICVQWHPWSLPRSIFDGDAYGKAFGAVNSGWIRSGQWIVCASSIFLRNLQSENLEYLIQVHKLESIQPI